MIVGLENLKEEIKRKQFYDFAVGIIKYQKFKTNVALKHINFDATDSTKSNYFTLGLVYLRDKERRPSIPKALYDALDEAMSKCIQPLTPSAEDERNTYNKNYHKKSAVLPVAKLDIVKKPLIEKYDMYGIKLPNGHIIPCKNEDYSDGYLAALKDCNVDTTDYKTILLKMSEV